MNEPNLVTQSDRKKGSAFLNPGKLPEGKDLPWEGAVAQNFAKHRHPIPSVVVDYIYSELDLKPQDPILDFGCGTGLLAVELLHRSTNVTGIDVSKAMLAEAERTVAGHPNKEFIKLSDTSLKKLAEAGMKFQTVFICRAFFAMPREAILNALEPLVTNDGAVVLIDDPNFYRVKEPWQKTVREVICAHYESRELPPLTRSHQNVLADSSFSNITEKVISVSRQWDVARVIGVLYSTGLGALAANASVDTQSRYEEALTRKLTELFPLGTWTEKAEFEVVVARRGE